MQNFKSKFRANRGGKKPQVASEESLLPSPQAFGRVRGFDSELPTGTQPKGRNKKIAMDLTGHAIGATGMATASLKSSTIMHPNLNWES